jgi:hypothetical protein
VKTRRTIAAMAAIGLFLGPVLGVQAQTNEPQLVPPELVPDSGTFWLIQLDGPFPFDPFPSLDVYLLDDGSFMIDDGSVVYPIRAGSSGTAQMDPDPTPPEEGDPGGGGNFPSTPVNYGCSLWLGVSISNDVAVVTLNNTRQNQTYSIWSTEYLGPGKWALETSVAGALGNLTQTIIPMNQRTNLFLRASEFRDYLTNAVFQGLSHTNTRAAPPDTMGAVGPNHFVELLNGLNTNTAIAVYDKSGTLISRTSMTNFFAVSGTDGTNYPTGDMADPRILFDRQSQRWLATAIQPNPGIVILAVSNDDSPTNLATGWTKYLIQVRQNAGEFLVDYDTLGLDANGVYVSALRGGLGTGLWHSVMAIKKPEIYQGTNLITLLQVTNLVSWTIQPAVNFDDVPADGPAWFVAKGPPDFSTNYQGGPLLYRRLQWIGTNAVWADENWLEVSNTGSTYQDYYDLDGTNVETFPTVGISASQGGTANGVNLYTIGSRLMMAVVRNQSLWTCHTVGLGGTNGTYTGDSSGTNVDRSANQWFKLQINPDGSGITMGDHGRVFDPAQTNAWWYYFPSLAVNCPGDMVMGFSGSSATNYISALYTWRLDSGWTLGTPRVIWPGQIAVTAGGFRWGDYSATGSDPADDWSFWTVQEYAGGSGAFSWRTVIANIRPSP